ncbi:hypothetical protein ACTHGU_21620 [Chitinophagaceae bacterium MMS25-I14]
MKDGTKENKNLKEENKNDSRKEMDNMQEDAARKGEQGQASYAPGSTTQGGSYYGQGTSDLGPDNDAYKQGSEKNKGANYDNEAGKLSEERDDIPHGQGAHRNEKESNAQEDYPGTQDDEEEKDQTV